MKMLAVMRRGWLQREERRRRRGREREESVVRGGGRVLSVECR